MAAKLADSAMGPALDQFDPAAQQSAYEDAWRRSALALATVAREARICQAIVWQNAALIRTCVDQVASFTEDAGPVNSKDRQRLMTMASYLQRYALKNDSIGFFGPVGWALLSSSAPESISLKADEQLLRRRTVYFEQWPIKALAGRLASDPQTRLHLRPVRSPDVYVDGRHAYHSNGMRVELSGPEEWVMRFSDGTRSIGDLHDEARSGSMPAGAELEARLELLSQRGLLKIDMDVPFSATPEVHYLEQIQHWQCPIARDKAREPVHGLLAHRANLAAAMGDAESLRRSFEAMNRFYSEASGSDSQRRSGEMYAARTLVYEDAMRGVDVTLGGAVMDELSRTLPLVLDSARWLAWRIAKEYEAVFSRKYQQLVKMGGSSEVPLARLIAAATPELTIGFRRLPAPVMACVREFQSKWANIVGDHHGGSIQMDPGDLRDKVAAEFGDCEPCWSRAVHHSPDLMICAGSQEALAAGEFTIVLGEIHVATNTMMSRLFVEQHPDRDQLLKAEARDYPSGRFVMLPSQRSPAVNARTYPSASSEIREFIYWTMHPDPAKVSLEIPVLPAAAMVVVNENGTLRVAMRNSQERHGLLEVMGDLMGSIAMNSFKLFPRGRHRPRVTVGRTVLAREAWRFHHSELAWAFARTACDRYFACRKWLVAEALPERVFYAAEVEAKPMFVDFSSVVLVEALSRVIRRVKDTGSDHVDLSEVLPDIGELWLRDVDGLEYTSEIRVVAVDKRSGPQSQDVTSPGNRTNQRTTQ